MRWFSYLFIILKEYGVCNAGFAMVWCWEVRAKFIYALCRQSQRSRWWERCYGKSEAPARTSRASEPWYAKIWPVCKGHSWKLQTRRWLRQAIFTHKAARTYLRISDASCRVWCTGWCLRFPCALADDTASQLFWQVFIMNFEERLRRSRRSTG